MQYPSKLIENAVNEVAKLPGIGKKTALRLVLHILKEDKSEVYQLSESLTQLRENIRYCDTCFNISDTEKCVICTSHRRDPAMVCVVEDTRDVMAVENTDQYFGLYHVLGGIISPVDGVGPEQLKIDALVDRAEQNSEIKEFILALPATMEGDTTAFYISKKLSHLPIKITNIARGVPVGGELEYTDEITLGRSISNRTQF